MLVTLPICFLIGFLLGQKFVKEYYASKFKAYYWNSDPVLIICKSSKLKEEEVVKALEFWKVRGHTVAFVDKDHDGKICKNKRLEGFIFIRKNVGRVTGNSLAVTHRDASGPELNFAEIQIPNYLRRNSLLLEHELGHAFGFNHVDEMGHIMNPIYDYMGVGFSYPKEENIF